MAALPAQEILDCQVDTLLAMKAADLLGQRHRSEGLSVMGCFASATTLHFKGEVDTR